MNPLKPSQLRAFCLKLRYCYFSEFHLFLHSTKIFSRDTEREEGSCK